MRTRGFTLIELLICIAVIACLAATVFAVIAYVDERDECSRRGGIMIADAFGLPTCVTSGVVVVPGSRR